MRRVYARGFFLGGSGAAADRALAEWAKITLASYTESWDMGGILKLDSATLEALERVAQASGKSPSSLARKALRSFLEDYWDMLDVKSRESSGEKPIPWTQVKQNLGLER